MERKIFCIIGERYKCVKFVKENHLSDAECLRQALDKARASDYILDNMMKGKGIVLQRVIPGKSRVCDIEEDDEICTDSDEICTDSVTVLLVDLNPTSQIPVAIATTSSTIMDCAQNIEAGDIMEIDIPILFEKKADADNLALNGTDVQVNVCNAVDSKTSKRYHQMDKSSGPGTVPNPAPLPQLTVELDDIRKKIGVLEGQKSFIYFWATHLSAITNNQPTKRDYLHYASSIVAAYPELKGGKGGCGIVKTQLSTCIRNRKAIVKKRCNKILKPVRSTPAEMASLVVDKEPTRVQIDIKDALKELEKSKGDTPHVRRLLKDTFDERRKWIQHDAKRIFEVVEKYPHLKLNTLVLSEFCTIKKWKEEEGAIETFITKVDTMIKDLGQHFGIEPNELGKAQIVLKLYESVTNKRLRKSDPLFLVKEVMSSTQDLMTVEGNSPRLVMFTMEEAIATAYVVADEFRMKIVEPSVCKSIACLLASYYV